MDSLLRRFRDGLDPDIEDANNQKTKASLSDLWIQTKDGRLINFGENVNEVQAQILDDVSPLWRDGDCTIRRGIRAYELKARQFGVSTLYLALYFLDTVNNSDTHTVVIADDEDNTEALFQKVHLFFEYLPDEKKPTKRYSNRKELAFDGIRSSFRVLTAGKKGAGRSRTLRNVHCSEVAFWPAAKTVMSGLLQAVPDDGNVTIESTANGEGSENEEGDLVGGEGAFFHVEWRKTQAHPHGSNGYDGRFTPWFALPSYRRTPPEGFTRTNGDSPLSLKSRYGDEEAYARRHGLDDAQLYWRRCKIDEPGMGNLFAQEYPSTAAEAFRVSGNTFFTEWDENRHIVPAFEIPKHWKRFGGVDWGYGNPFCFLYAAMDEWGGIVITAEAYAKRLLNSAQSSRIADIITASGWTKDRVPLYCDPSMWNTKMTPTGVGYRDVDDYIAAGLICVQANNTRTRSNGSGGWSNVRQYLHDDVTNQVTGETYPALRILEGACPNLKRTLPLMVHDKNNPEDMDSDQEDHAVDPLRYFLNAWIRALVIPAPEKPTQFMKIFGPGATTPARKTLGR